MTNGGFAKSFLWPISFTWKCTIGSIPYLRLEFAISKFDYGLGAFRFSENDVEIDTKTEISDQWGVCKIVSLAYIVHIEVYHRVNTLPTFRIRYIEI